MIYDCLDELIARTLAVVVAQLAERSLSKQTVRGSKPVIGKKLLNICLLLTVLKRQKQRKRVWECPIKSQYRDRQNDRLKNSQDEKTIVPTTY